ncbi:MAG TPA: hypothetical protein VIJ16_09550 [Gemmatimonadaceae bacterium]
MNQHKHSPHQPGPEHRGLPHDSDPYWKRAHRDWRFWVGVVLVVFAMTMFVVSGDLTFR